LDWFEKLTGFPETDYESTRAKLVVEGRRLRSFVNGVTYSIGELEVVSLQALRDRTESVGRSPRRLKVSVIIGDVRRMHQLRENAGALFQVASQFNLLEMVGPSVTPEEGVTRYKDDHTQGPACAIAAGAATIYRNYFAPVGGSHGQSAKCQIDTLAKLGEALSGALNMPVSALWKMQNGYALCTRTGLDAITGYLGTLDAAQTDILGGKLCIGVHHDVEATEATGEHRPLVSQVFCSALPVAYSPVASLHWEKFACLVLQAAYEATMWAAVLNARRGASNIVFLTFLGGGAFGNADAWIYSGIRRALRIVANFDLDVRLVSYKMPSKTILQMVEEFR
jgi:hypothetical protein